MVITNRVIRGFAGVSVGLAVLIVAAPTLADVNAVTPSTNDINRTLDWAHVNLDVSGPGFVTLEFVSERNFASCFEFRTDGDTSQITDAVNYNPDITDGLYPFVCVVNDTDSRTIFADEYVEVRMVFGAEGDERFDWTWFDVSGVEACKKDGWMQFGFRNQGQCVRFAQTGKDSR